MLDHNFNFVSKLLLTLTVSVGFYGCKNNLAKLSSDDPPCTPLVLAKLKAELLATSRQDPMTSLELTRDAASERLINQYTYNNFLQRNDFDAAIAKAPAEGWQLNMSNGCMQYAVSEAKKNCGTMNCGFFSINPTNTNYINYRTKALTQCQNDFHAYVQAKSIPPKPTPPSDDGKKPDEFSDQTDQNSAKDEAAKLQRERKIAELRAKITKCEADIKRQQDSEKDDQTHQPSADEFQANCEAAGGHMTRQEPPYECVCQPFEVINPFKGLCPQIVSDDSKKPEPPITPPPAAKCECSFQNGLCSKVVDGKVVASLTPILNTVTGKQETCSPGGGGGYDNLCNQPQLKCP